MNKPVRVRIAPSPTGFMHIGTARTALFNFVFAKQHGGTFLLRVEDTDKERSKKEYEDDIIKNLAWLGFAHDEFYRQSEHVENHKQYLKKLLDAGKAFWCAHTVEELEAEGLRQREAKEPPRHICNHRDVGKTSGIVRLRNDEHEPIVIHDMIRGDITYDPQLFGDVSLAKNLDEPLFNFVVVVDDYEMKISHVIRGEDHITNTPKQIMIGRALGFTEPEWAHLPLLLAKDRTKLSKRNGAVSVGEYRDAGYIQEALINFLALLGWHPKDEVGEVMDLETIIKEFDITRVQKGGAIVETEKLDWLNREHLRRLPPDEQARRADPYISADTKTQINIRIAEYVNVVLPRITKLTEIDPIIREILNPPDYDAELLLWKGKIERAKAKEVLEIILASLPDTGGIEAALKYLFQKEGKGTVLWPFRVALSGRAISPGPFELHHVLGLEESRARITKAIAKLDA
ncbi:MAG: glutamate--tRNA ligase [Patescibacteria group bacterium]